MGILERPNQSRERSAIPDRCQRVRSKAPRLWIVVRQEFDERLDRTRISKVAECADDPTAQKRMLGDERIVKFLDQSLNVAERREHLQTIRGVEKLPPNGSRLYSLTHRLGDPVVESRRITMP
jgi:hypothetical protein